MQQCGGVPISLCYRFHYMWKGWEPLIIPVFLHHYLCRSKQVGFLSLIHAYRKDQNLFVNFYKSGIFGNISHLSFLFRFKDDKTCKNSFSTGECSSVANFTGFVINLLAFLNDPIKSIFSLPQYELRERQMILECTLQCSRRVHIFCLLNMWVL